MATMRSLASVAVLLLWTIVAAISTTGNRLLVILDHVSDGEAYSLFMGDLAGRGFDISYETPRSEGLKLFYLGERNYDHLLFLPTRVKGLGPNLTPNILVDFVNAGGNILVALTSASAAPSSLVAFLAEVAISLPPERTSLVVDHFNYDAVSAADTHDVLVMPVPLRLGPHVKPLFEMHDAVVALPRASAHVLGQSSLVTPILRAPRTAYCYNPKEQLSGLDADDDLFAAGEQLALVSGMQALNSARVAVLGSAEMLKDEWLAEERVVHSVASNKEARLANREFAKRLSGWTFEEIGVLRVTDMEHRLVGSNETNPESYRIKNQVSGEANMQQSFSISMWEHEWDHWVPYTPPSTDRVQVEFSMLSPFYRLDLAAAESSRSDEPSSSAVLGRNFTLPDQHGIFNFRVTYKRPYLTYIDEKQTVSVRHMAHDEWPRSWAISGAWPWLAGIWATAVGFVGFCAVWMYSAPPKGGKR
ncbi:hypothetical protein CDD82_6322 [Ophiocordyceps australis]|uniref:Dolichyl-diphosphooligosaccharide--protein glycosyltransferase subunit WBP1 n=1 Tax=Ophiocordyceps australis TaxID=1399860 RepID=A0A2C5Y163_9HYPO|nr:hypothetical protein CDD82_6322 [Ophiocordyceps australis]